MLTKLFAYARLVRTLNLFFIALTQALFYFFVVVPVFYETAITPTVQQIDLFLIILASVMIAAGGYVINDYFDLDIDRINRPENQVITKYIPRRHAILLHLFLSIVGLVISFIISNRTGNYLILFGNTVCVVLLWLYSTSFKKKFLVGNVVISLLTAWVILIFYFAEFSFTKSFSATSIETLSKLYRIAMVYAGFAFIISISREIIKDIEDKEGDEKYGCHTIPIVWGNYYTKLFVLFWLLLLLVGLVVILGYVFPFRWWAGISYILFLVILPIIILIKRLLAAKRPEDFKKLSHLCKFIMLTGIMSMVFFKLYL